MHLAALLLCLLLHAASSANILGVFPTPARSHSLVFESLLHELAARGHHVTFASAITSQLPTPSNASGGSFKSILLDHGRILEANMGGIVGPERRPLVESMTLWQLAPSICEHELASPELQPLIHDKNITFDVVIIEVFFFDCMLPFARHFNAPLITITSQWAPPWAHAQLGNPDLPSVSPNMFLPYGDAMPFLQRAHNALHTELLLLVRRLVYLPRQDAVVRHVFGNDTPPLAHLERHVSLMLTNTHPLLNFPHPSVPGVIEVGGMHIQPVKQLPKDLAEYMDSASEGVVLFSLGSLINSDNLPPGRLQLLTKAMTALPCKVLWRWDTRDVPGLPDNVRIEAWIPQRDILAHSNVKVLVTHGGLLSAQEAALEGVPRLVLPFFGDQHMNAWRSVQLEVGLALNFYSAKPEQLATSIVQLLTQPKYRENAKQVSRELCDQLESPLDRAVFWTEYVIRHNGAPHLRSAATQLSWYQLYLLDVAAAILVVLISILIVAKMIVKSCLRICTPQHEKND